MKNQLEIFSTGEIKNFFNNLSETFEISYSDYKELEASHKHNKLSLVLLRDDSHIPKNIIEKINKNENFIIICKDFSVFQKFSLDKKNTLISPISINKLLDVLNNIINSKKYTYKNIVLSNHALINTKTNEKAHLTQAENYILLKLFNEKNVKKKTLEREALQIKKELNTSSMESHLNRIRKKLKLIKSQFTVTSKDGHIYLYLIS